MLEFYCSYDGIDIWKEIDTKLGVIKFIFYLNNESYSTDTISKAHSLISFVKLSQLQDTKTNESKHAKTL